MRVIIMMMLAVAVPGAGLAAALCAALVLWALVQNANRRHGGYGSGSGVSGVQRRQRCQRYRRF